MHKVIFIAALLAATPALAGDPFDTGDSYGPGNPSGTTSYGNYVPAKPSPCPKNAVSGSFTCYLSGPIGSGNAGTVLAAGATPQFPLTDAELATQIAASKRYNEHLEAVLIEAGGCQAPVLPYWVAAYCNQKAFSAGHGNGTPGSEN